MARIRRTLTEQAHREIKRRIVTLELTPGQRIDDHRMAADLSLSRTPVREALSLLAAEGLVSAERGTGFMVRSIDLTDIGDLFELHVVVAKATARLAALRAMPEDVRAMSAAADAVEAAIEHRDHLAITRTNAELHRREVAATHNLQLARVTDSVLDQGQRLAYLCFGGGGREWAGLEEHFATVAGQHRELIAAYEAHAPEAAQAVATAHVATFRRRVQAYLDAGALDDLTFDELARASLPATRLSRVAGGASG